MDSRMIARLEDHLRSIVDNDVTISTRPTTHRTAVEVRLIKGPAGKKFHLAFTVSHECVHGNGGHLYDALLKIITARGRYFLHNRHLLDHARHQAYQEILRTPQS